MKVKQAEYDHRGNTLFANYINALGAEEIAALDEFISKLCRDGTLLLNRPEVEIDEERKFNLYALKTGYLPVSQPTAAGIPISLENIRAAGLPLRRQVGRAPHAGLLERWQSMPSSGMAAVESFDVISRKVKEARSLSFGDALTESCRKTGHVEDMDFADEQNLEVAFFYLEKFNIHCRRIAMLADLVVHAIREALKTKPRVHLVDFGPGLFALERMIIAQLSPAERKATCMMAFDVSPDLLGYGLSSSFIDRGVLSDFTMLDEKELSRMVPEPDVVVYAEILEHIEHPAALFKANVLPWVRTHGGVIVGSVPNAVQLPEMIPLLTGIGSPHQLRRPLIDTTNNHLSHHTASSLSEILVEVWGCEDSGILSNGVRISKDSDDALLVAGLTSPHLGDRLIFWAKTGEPGS